MKKTNTNEIIRTLNFATGIIADQRQARNVATGVLMDAMRSSTMKKTGGLIINEDLNLVVITVPEEQQKDYGVVAMSYHCDDIVTTDAPKLPIPDGIYRGRTRNNKFTMIAYFGNIMVDMGCYNRNDIRISDPFWIDLRTLKYEEYEGPHAKAEKIFRTEMELRSTKRENANLVEKTSRLEEENKNLKARIKELEDEVLNLKVQNFDPLENEKKDKGAIAEASDDDDDDLYI